MTWDLNDKYLALSLWHDNELSPAEREQVAARLAADASWREAYETMRDTERALAASLLKNAKLAEVDLALARVLTGHRLDETAFPAEVTAQALPSSAELRLIRVLAAHRLDEQGFPAEVSAQVFRSAAERWLVRVLCAHRLDEKFVRRVMDARQIESFQEPLESQLKDALRGHRVGTSFVDKIVSGAQLQSKALAQPAVPPASPLIADVPVVRIGEAAAAPQPATGTPQPRRRTPNRPLTPARGSAVAAKRGSSARRAPLSIVPVSTPAKHPVSLLRWVPLAAAAALLLVVLGVYAFRPPVAPIGQPVIVAQQLNVTVYKHTGTAEASPVGLPGYVFDRAMAPATNSLDSGENAGALLLLSDASTHQTIARVILDRNTSVRWAGSTAGAPRGSLTLLQGGLLADVEKSGQSFQIHMTGGSDRSDETVTVHGTRFFVHADGKNTSVDVLEG
ncbi:MAG TPA: FecR family protein, partial [Planctomycetota bacterium]|nr:FecR family protein [Planctomycetota bacterium]